MCVLTLTTSPNRQKSEDNLNSAEAELEKQNRTVEDLHHKCEELQVQADEAVRLKDQVDECVTLLFNERAAPQISLMIGIDMQLISCRRPRT